MKHKPLNFPLYMNFQKTRQVLKGNTTVIRKKFVKTKLFPKNMLVLTGRDFPVSLHFVLKFLNSSNQVFVLVQWQQWDHHPVMLDSKPSFAEVPFSSCEFLLCEGSHHYLKVQLAFQISFSWREKSQDAEKEEHQRHMFIMRSSIQMQTTASVDDIFGKDG